MLAARPGGLDALRREALHPSVDGDVIDGGAALRQQFLKIAVGQPIPEVQRTATPITSRGNGKPAKTEDLPEGAGQPTGAIRRPIELAASSGGRAGGGRYGDDCLLDHLAHGR